MLSGRSTICCSVVAGYRGDKRSNAGQILPRCRQRRLAVSKQRSKRSHESADAEAEKFRGHVALLEVTKKSNGLETTWHESNRMFAFV
jgi:hypothetical protein